MITDYSKFPAWRKDVTRVEMLRPVNGKPSWREYDNHGGSIPYEVMVMVPPRALVVRIADPKLPFGGTWTYEISSMKDGSSMVRITEAGEIYNPIFRVAARYVLGYSRTQEQYLQALGAKFGQPRDDRKMTTRNVRHARGKVQRKYASRSVIIRIGS